MGLAEEFRPDEATDRLEDTRGEAEAALTAAELARQKRRDAELLADHERMMAAEQGAALHRAQDERRYVLSSLQAARSEASAAAFGKYLILAVICAALLVLGVWAFFRARPDDDVFAAPQVSTGTR